MRIFESFGSETCAIFALLLCMKTVSLRNISILGEIISSINEIIIIKIQIMLLIISGTFTALNIRRFQNTIKERNGHRVLPLSARTNFIPSAASK